MDKILLIGNGNSVLDNKYGDMIDNGPWKICRFNNFETAGYEEYVGSRTDILARRSCDDVKLFDSDTLEKIYTFVTYSKWTSGMMNVARDVQSYYQDRCEVVGLKICREIGEAIGLDQPLNEWASIGSLMLGYLHLTKPEVCDRIILHGFDDPLNKNSHYFKKPPRDACYHNWQKEYEYINSLGLKKLEFI